MGFMLQGFWFGVEFLELRISSVAPAISYRGASLIRNRPPLGPYSRPMPRALCWSWGGWLFLMSEVPPVAGTGDFGPKLILTRDTRSRSANP